MSNTADAREDIGASQRTQRLIEAVQTFFTAPFFRNAAATAAPGGPPGGC